VALRAGADASVDAAALCASELARQAANRVGCDAAVRGHALGGERGDARAQRVQAGDMGLEPAQPHQALGKQHLHHRRQQERVGPGPDRVVRVGHPRRLGAARVDHDDAPAARPQRLGLAAEIGHRP
jgi:hypothetical protein